MKKKHKDYIVFLQYYTDGGSIDQLAFEVDDLSNINIYCKPFKVITMNIFSSNDFFFGGKKK